MKCTDDIARSTISFHALEAEMLKDDQKYLEMLERGKHIIDLLNKGVGREESLSKENIQALAVYRKQSISFDTDTVVLRPCNFSRNRLKGK